MLTFIQDLWGFASARKKYWLIPVTLALALLGAIIVLSSGSVLAPFIYTLF